MLIVGIDPGLTGAIASSDGEVYDMPTVTKGKGTGVIKSHVDGIEAYRIIYHFYEQSLFQSRKMVVYIEEQVYRKTFKPGGIEIPQGGSSIFSLGDSYGAVRVLPGLLGVKLVHVMPAKWKKALGLSTDKEVSRATAINLFPNAPLHAKKHHNRAEALLLAYYGQKCES